MSEDYIVAICTLGDNLNLVRCVSNLQSIKNATSRNMKILIVFNRESTELRFDSEIDVAYEPNKGYSNVRNVALANTPTGSNLIFIDDDEIPTLTWFEAIADSHESYPHDVIFGPVYSESESNLDSYRARFKERYESLVDGALVKQAGAGNMLIPSNLLAKENIFFDPFFNESGSEDTDLCFRLRKNGIRIRFSMNAVISEVEEEERRDPQYLSFRQLKDVCNYSVVIRRNSGLLGILWRFSTLASRVVLFSVLCSRDEKFRFQRTMYIKSLRALLRGRHNQ
jgi:GT2 family glycosyltransferase